MRPIQPSLGRVADVSQGDTRELSARRRREIEDTKVFKEVVKDSIEGWVYFMIGIILVNLIASAVLFILGYKFVWIIALFVMVLALSEGILMIKGSKRRRMSRIEKFTYNCEISERITLALALFMFFLCETLGLKLYTLTIIPRGFSFLLVIIQQCLEKQYAEVDSYYRGIKVAIKLSYLIIQLNISLKLDEFVDWEWESIFWPFWILSALYFGAVLLSAITVVWKLCPIIFCLDKTPGRSLAVIWLCFNMIGISLYSVIFFFLLEYSLSQGKLMPALTVLCLVAAIGGLVLLLATIPMKNNILDMFLWIRQNYLEESREAESSSSESSDNGSGSRRREGRQRREMSEDERRRIEQREKQANLIERSRRLGIPKYLVKLGQSFFGRATPKEIFFGRMELSKKKLDKAKKKMKSLKGTQRAKPRFVSQKKVSSQEGRLHMQLTNDSDRKKLLERLKMGIGEGGKKSKRLGRMLKMGSLRSVSDREERLQSSQRSDEEDESNFKFHTHGKQENVLQKGSKFDMDEEEKEKRESKGRQRTKEEWEENFKSRKRPGGNRSFHGFSSNSNKKKLFQKKKARAGASGNLEAISVQVGARKPNQKQDEDPKEKPKEIGDSKMEKVQEEQHQHPLDTAFSVKTRSAFSEMRVNSPSSSSDSEDENKEISSPVKLKSKMTKEKKKGLEEKLRKDSNIRKSHDNALCVLCFDNKADSVIMPCGHGGICNTCALELFSSCNQCPICRSDILQVVLIKESKKNSKLTKVISVWEIDSDQSDNEEGGASSQQFRSSSNIVERSNEQSSVNPGDGDGAEGGDDGEEEKEQDLTEQWRNERLDASENPGDSDSGGENDREALVNSSED